MKPVIPAALALALVSAPALSQTYATPAPAPRPEAIRPATPVASDEAVYVFRPHDRAAHPEIGVETGNAGEVSFAYRGRYELGECPEGSIITPFGTCATGY